MCGAHRLGLEKCHLLRRRLASESASGVASCKYYNAARQTVLYVRQEYHVGVTIVEGLAFHF
jgi:hypothetical protein